MFMATSVADAIAQHCVDDLNAALGSGAVLQGWTGTIPTSLGGFDGGVNVAELACATSTVFGDPVAFVSTANTFNDDTDCVAGTITYWRLKTSGGTPILQMSEGSEITTDNPVFDDGDTCHLDSLEMTLAVGPPDA